VDDPFRFTLVKKIVFHQAASFRSINRHKEMSKRGRGGLCSHTLRNNKLLSFLCLLSNNDLLSWYLTKIYNKLLFRKNYHPLDNNDFL
jgi:hypothetical protein